MRAAVCVRAGGPEVLEIRELPVPAVRQGWSLVRVKGAGLNRSELRTRQGHSPNVTFPRVLGIECVGIVAASTDPTLPDGATVAAVMGEMGRDFDGGYAEYALLPNLLLMPVTTTLQWDILAALPESCGAESRGSACERAHRCPAPLNDGSPDAKGLQSHHPFCEFCALAAIAAVSRHASNLRDSEVSAGG